MEFFNHQIIDKKWQDKWEQDGLYETPANPKNKKYVLDMFPYPSGAGLHVGHPEGYTATDILSRYLRMNGHDVLHPMGWDAFGLPAENYAIKQGVPPWESTAENINHFREQIKSIGLSYDWSREVNTSEPEYYRWTQWLFLQLYKKGLAYKKEASVNWCPKDKTVLANEQVVNGNCERCGTPVVQKLLSQWFFKITDYADRLLNDMDKVDWPEPIRQMQKNWIGRSEGAEIDFEIANDFNYVILHGFNGSPSKPAYAWLNDQIKDRGHNVVLPQLPNPANPTEEEQVDYVLKNVQFDRDTVLYGKSLGSVVALKVLEKLETPIAGLILVGGFLDGTKLHKKYPFETTFKWQFDFDKIKKNVGFIRILSDLSDTQAVPVEQGRLLHEKLGGEFIETVSIEQHFLATEEPAVLNAVFPQIKVFTTRPDTLFGATYMVLAPEHPLITNLQSVITNFSEVQVYVEATKQKTELQRTALEKDKTGIELKGIKAINPATKEQIPVWIADYVMSNYGTGAIMAVPAHDMRDFEFAKKYNLPIKEVIKPEGIMPKYLATPASAGRFGIVPGQNDLEFDCWTGDGILVNSEMFDGKKSEEMRPKMAAEFGRAKVQYKLRDWLVSRQRYWGAPIPVIYCSPPAGGCGMQPVPETDLPVKLPTDVDFLPTGESPIARSKTFHVVKCPKCGADARRDSDTMDTFVDSSWYFFRFTDPHNDKEFASPKMIKQWLPVDTYVGGAEHAVLHLLYARFFSKALSDMGLIDYGKVPTGDEPFAKLRNQGLIMGPDGEKMSKSRGNVINPDEVVKEFGADAFRMYEMFMGPLEDSKPWAPTGIVGVKRFLDKAWRHQQAANLGSDKPQIHKLIKKVTSDIGLFKFNTAISAFMEFLNENKDMSKQNWETLLILLAPFAPHMTEELWAGLGHTDSIHTQAWPKYEEKLTIDDTVTVVVQILGKMRTSLRVPAGSNEETVKVLALADANVQKHMANKSVTKVIFVTDKVINFVIK